MLSKLVALPKPPNLLKPDELDEPNYFLKQLRGKLTHVEQCFSAENFASLLNIGGVEFLLGERSMESANLPVSEVVLSTYFTSRSDPQRFNYVDQNNYDYIKPLYESVKKLSLGCIIFYDELTPEFVTKYTTDKIRFVKTKLGQYSLNDDRFYIYYEYLLCYGQHFERILLSDVSDVIVRASPFPLISQYPDKLFAGRSNLDRIRHNYVQYQRIQRFEQDSGVTIPKDMYNMRIFNAGTIGGSRRVIVYTIRQMILQFNKFANDRNHNMTVFNYSIYLHWLENRSQEKVRFLSVRYILLKIAMLLKAKVGVNLLPRHYFHDNSNYSTDAVFAGLPFTSAFKKFEKDSEAFLIHK